VNKSDFSSERLRGRRPRWVLYMAVLLLHVLALAGLNAALTLNRLAAQAPQSFEVAILPQDAPVPKPVRPKPAPVKTEPLPEVPTEPAPEPVPMALPEPAVAASEPTPMPAVVVNVPPPDPDWSTLRAMTPDPVLLRYSVTKDGDSARANLSWQPRQGDYELSYEATYFGFSIIKQVSSGAVGALGLAPTRFGEKRRGRSEQATHFERAKGVVTFSNHRPESKLPTGAQDRASFLIQLASLFAGQPEKFKVGHVIEVPVASVDELELWAFEVQASELLMLPIGETPAIKVLRRPRRAFDPTVEVWLAPALSYLPVRIRLTDSGGVTDSQLASRE
jgi:Protein of unknown function (DUF3108)